MPAPLRPAAGFDWTAVSWGGPDQQRTTICSYCEAPIVDDDCDYLDVPLILTTEDGWVAEFCDACQRKWWGAS